MLICYLKNDKVLDFDGECDYVSLKYDGRIAEFRLSPIESASICAIIPVENILYIKRESANE